MSFLKKNMMRRIKTYTLNFGPQHPAAHGVLRLILEINGEVIKKADAHIGLLHRGTEKLSESKHYTQVVPYFDRLDYVSMMAQEHSFALCIEYLLKLHVPRRAQYIRTIYLEITRILNHLMSLTTHALDVGALTPFLWAFEEREKLMGLYESVSGARLHSAFIIAGGVAKDLMKGVLNDIYNFITGFYYRICELEELLNNNRVWKQRLINVGVTTKENFESWGFSGVMVRGSGLAWDLRKAIPYEVYSEIPFKIVVSGEAGDCYDRFKVRVGELYESLNIIEYCLSKIQIGYLKSFSYKINRGFNFKMKESMEFLIDHFKLSSEGGIISEDRAYSSTEAPKGEFGVYLISNGLDNIYRNKIRAPGFFHLQGVDFMARNHLLADVVTIIGTQDIVFGEVDR